MSIIYLTSDLSSAHTEKRVKWFKLNRYKFKLLGCANSNNIDSNRDKNVFLFKSGIKGYLQRILFSLSLIIKERNSLKNNILIVRGFEYVFFLWIFRINFIKEITDIPSSFFNYKFLRFFFKILLKNKIIFFTSKGYNKIFEFKNKNIFVWHNNPVLNKNQNINRPNKRIVYAGYLRGLPTLSQKLDNLKIDLWGKLNIITQDYKSNFVSKNYKGTYLFKNLSNLYGQYQLSYISDFYGENSKFNLTNRLYESVFNNCIPIEINNNYQKSFLDKLGIIYFDSSNAIKNYDQDFYTDYVINNYKLLSKKISNDESCLILFLNNYFRKNY